MILDLQFNTGGDLFVGGALAQHVIPERTTLGVLHGRRFGFIPWKTTYLLVPEPESYGGPLVVLVNGETASMAEHVARALRRSGRARLIGERTLGAAGPRSTASMPRMAHGCPSGGTG